MNQPIHHHYVSQAYLRGFAAKEGKHWKIEVADLIRGTTFRTNVRNVAGERHFNRIAVEGFDPNYLETQLGNIEGEFSEARRRIESSRVFEGNERMVVLNLIALMAVRNPGQRENIRGFHERLMKMTMDVALATKERWESQMKRMERDGQGIENPLPYEEIKKFHESGEYTIDVNQDYQIGLELKQAETLIPWLFRRKWSLVIATEGEFITSNTPVTLAYKRPNEIPSLMRHSPGYGVTDTELVFPLSERSCLISTFEDDEVVRDVGIEYVGRINSRTISLASEQLYARKKIISYVGPPGLTHYRDDKVLERLAGWKK